MEESTHSSVVLVPLVVQVVAELAAVLLEQLAWETMVALVLLMAMLTVQAAAEAALALLALTLLQA